MWRREFVTLLGGAAVVWPLATRAQQPDGTPIIGLLFAGTMTSYARNLKAFRDGMHELGYDEGRNIRFAYRFADGYLDRLPGLAAELVFLKPNVIVCSPLPANLAAHRANQYDPNCDGERS